MDDSQMQARGDATAMVSRNFEPVRIERQLLARAFDLLCERDALTVGPPQKLAEQPAGDVERRRAA